MFTRLSAFFGMIAIVAAVGCGGEGGTSGTSGGSGSGNGSGNGSGSGSGSASSGGSSGHKGETQCGGVTCQPGQYCDNIACLNGCLSGNNCGENQSCKDIDPMTHVGTCQDDPAAKDCDTYCQKSMACGGPIGILCQMECDASSTACVSCVNDSNCGQGCEGVCGK